MNEMQVFNFNEAEVRTVMISNEPWWVAKDVCEVFGETNYRRSVQSLDDDDKGVSQINTPGGLQNMIVVNESGLYALLFSMQPAKARGVDGAYIDERTASLKKFKKWVTSEVLPSIRKHGIYATAPTIEDMIANPDHAIKLLEALKVERAAKAELEAEKKALVAEVQYKDEVITGLVEDVDVYTMRTVINRVVRRGGKPAERYRELYQVFRETNHVDLPGRADGYNLKQSKKKDHLNGIGYAEKFGHMPALYETAIKLYETDIEQTLADIKRKR